jgi:hypothetical protein
MKKLFLLCSILTSYIILLASPVKADDEVRNLTIDTKAKGYTQTEWQDNLNSSSIIFAPRDKFEIQLKIKNDGNRNQTNIHITSAVPASSSLDMPDFIINQITPGQEFTQNIIVTIKDKNFVYKDLKANTVKLSMKSDVGSEGSDTITYYTSNGLKGIATTTPVVDINTPTLPVTGATTTILFGSAFAAILAFAGSKLRRYARGY